VCELAVTVDRTLRIETRLPVLFISSK